MKIKNAIAFVTGANRGLGRSLLHALLDAGASKVYAAARDTTQLPVDARIVPVSLDITSHTQVADAAKLASDVTLLINNAGTMAALDVLTAKEADIERDLRTNLFGTLSVIKALIPALHGGTIVNVLSLASLASVPSMGGYAASKAAAYSITQALRAQLKPRGISVLAALAGPIDTDMVRALQLPKAAPASVAKALLDGIERGDEEIFPDPMAQQMSALWSRNPKEFERAFSAY
jgi:NAD(P)-dependent dehydrogenase (short-subunit alcohol dehydrogenase family)